MASAAASDCLSGCVRGVRNLPELLRPGRERLGWTRASSPQGQDDALSPRRVERETDGMAVSVPQLSCPGLISRSQSALSEEAPSASFAVETLRAVEAVETVEAVEAVEALERPTLLTASKAVSPKSIRSQGGKLCTSPRFDGLEGPDGPDGSLSALTTATAFEATAFDEGSPVNAQALTCCIAGAHDSNDWLWDASLAVGAASWTGAKHVASFLGNQIYEAAAMAQPHVQSMANSAADALKAAAEDSMGKIRALGPRRSKLQRARASLALEPPHLQKPTLPALPPLPELGAYTAQMGLCPAPFPAPTQPGTNRTLSAPLPTCSSFPTQAPTHSYGHTQSYHAGYQAYQSQAFQGYNHGYKVYSQGNSGYPQTYQGQLGQLQPSYSFAHASLPRTSTFLAPGMHHAHSFSVQETPLVGRRVPLAPCRIKSATS